MDLFSSRLHEAFLMRLFGGEARQMRALLGDLFFVRRFRMLFLLKERFVETLEVLFPGERSFVPFLRCLILMQLCRMRVSDAHAGSKEWRRQ
jgi:hypothetical protein